MTLKTYAMLFASSAIVETTHKAIGQIIRAMVAAKPPESLDDAQRLCDAAIATVLHATRCASNMNLGGSSPGSLAYRRDMHLDIPLIADVHVLRDIRQAKIDERLLRSNASRVRHEWKVGQWAHVKKLYESKHKARPVYGPKRRIVQVHTNGTVSVQIRPGVVERYNIRRLKPRLDL